MSNIEQRRYPRLSSRQQATVRVAGLALRGEIRDYCRAGLYLAFDRPLAADLVRTLAPASPVQVEFDSERDGRPRQHRLQGCIARSLPTGLGLQMATMPEEVLDALQVAGACAGAQAERGPLSGRRADAPTRQAIQQECSRLFSAFLKDVLEDFFQQSPGQLEEASDLAVGTSQRACFTDAAREITGQRAQVTEQVIRSIREALRRPTAREPAAAPAVAAAELALVDEEQFEDWLSLSTVVHQVESELSLPLAELHRRYGALRDTPMDRATNPFGPQTVCRAFQGAMLALNLPLVARAVAYKSFGLTLARSCPGLYEQMNEVLARLDEPAPTAGPVARPPDDPAGPVARPPDAPAEPVVTAHRPTVGRDDLGELFDTVQALQRQMQPTPSATSADYSLDRLLAALSRSSAARGAAPAPPAVRSDAARGSAPAAPALSESALLQAIDRLLQPAPASSVQTSSVPAGVEPSERGATAGTSLSARLVAALPGMTLPAPQRQALGASAGLLARALTESDVGSEIQALLRRLERPLLNVALRDPGFIESPDHPARRLVDLLEEFSIATDERGRFYDGGLRRFLQRMVDRIVRGADEHPALFEQARLELARLLVPIRETRRLRVAGQQEACEARDRIRRARRQVNDGLAQRLGGRQAPGIVLRLLEVGWRQHLVLLALRSGTHDEGWRQGWAVLDRLLEWFAPDRVPDAGFRQEATALVNRIEPAVAAVSVDAGQLEAFIEALEQALQSAQAGGEPPPAVLYPLPGPGDGGDAMPAAALEAWSRRLRLGDWWLIPRGDRSLPMQLIWTSRPAGHCAFASRSAGERHELSLAELARQAELGRARPCSDRDRPLLERSTFSLLDEGRQALQQRALRDPVSGLLNRKGLLQSMAQLARASGEGASHALGVLEFDQLRMIFNACGVEAAEGLVRSLARAAQDCVGDTAIVSSLRDDTLAVLVCDVDPQTPGRSAEPLLERLGDYRFEHGEQRYRIGLNIGLARYAPAEIEPEEAIRRADAACIAAKAQGRNRIQLYERDSAQVKNQESLADWAGRVDRLLEGPGLYLRAQMVMPIGTEASLQPYYEILLGIETAPGVPAAPMSFVSAMERLNRSHELDLWVMRQTLRWIEDNRRIFDTIGGFAINVSPLSLGRPEVMAFLHQQLARSEVPAGKLAFEITETAAIDGYGAAREFIQQIRRYGCKISLDDFGSGYASYAHLKNLRADTLKIDGSFVKDMASSDSDRAMVKSMHDIARSLGMRTVAEFVETPPILARLREIGVDYAQGYAIHKPCPISELTGF